MDTIKFRYIFKDKKGKIYKEIFSLVDIERGDIDNALMGFDHDDIEIEIIAKDRFTGLYDENKKEIYEGDIVKSIKSDAICKINIGHYDDKTSSQDGIIGVWFEVIGKIKPYGFTKAVMTKNNESIIEIIGNIYETSELLK